MASLSRPSVPQSIHAGRPSAAPCDASAAVVIAGMRDPVRTLHLDQARGGAVELEQFGSVRAREQLFRRRLRGELQPLRRIMFACTTSNFGWGETNEERHLLDMDHLLDIGGFGL